MDPIDALLAWAGGPAFSLVQAARIAVALSAIPLLYRFLREDPEQQRDIADRIRPVLFTLLGVAVLYFLSSRWEPAPTSMQPGRGFQAFSSGVMSYRLSHSPLAEMAPPPEGKSSHTELAVEQLRKAVELLPESVYLKRYYGIVLAERGQYGKASTMLGEAMDLLARRAPQRSSRERELWRAFFGPVKPTRAAVDALATQVSSYDLGWIGKVATLAAYRRIGVEAPPVRREVRQGAGTYMRRLFTAFMMVLFLLPQVTLIAVTVGGVLIADKVLSPVPQAIHPTGPILMEGFILMLALGMVPGFIAFPGGRPAPETAPAAFAGLLLVSDVVQLLALGYLWFRLRGRGLTLDEIGLSRKELGLNIVIGVGAAAVVIPCAYMLGLATHTLGERFFPNIAPPHHPLGILTATSSSWEIRGALFIGAVVGAPFLEEIFFRGALFGALRRKQSFWAALLASSAFFSILHPQLPLGFLPIAALGGAFAALYEWRKSLVPGMVAHALNNSIPFLMLNLMFPTRG